MSRARDSPFRLAAHRGRWHDRSMDKVDCIIAGAGVVGLAIARALARRGIEVLVLEPEEAFGTGTSSRNSEVIHAGIYYPTAA